VVLAVLVAAGVVGVAACGWFVTARLRR
jgi:hypothetical protein